MENLKSDLISRKALLGKMFPYGMPDNGNYGINARAVRDAVVGAKAVEAEPVVHARWEFKDLSQIAPNCSNCGMQSIMAYPNCPYCRAKMENGRKPKNED